MSSIRLRVKKDPDGIYINIDDLRSVGYACALELLTNEKKEESMTLKDFVDLLNERLANDRLGRH